jgi:hypothetical protein
MNIIITRIIIKNYKTRIEFDNIHIDIVSLKNLLKLIEQADGIGGGIYCEDDQIYIDNIETFNVDKFLELIKNEQGIKLT